MFLTGLLLVGASITNLASAYPHQPDMHETRDETLAALETRAGLKLKVGRDPTTGVTCPETNNANFPHQDEHAYTTNQIKQAFLEGAKLAAAGKSLGDSEFPFLHTHSISSDLTFLKRRRLPSRFWQRGGPAFPVRQEPDGIHHHARRPCIRWRGRQTDAGPCSF
jgi:hypothetical protein